MSTSDSCDVYNISNNLLKLIILSIVPPLKVCINLCLRDGYFPDQLKMTRVYPVHKKGPKDKPDSFHPISLIPVLSKVI